MLRFSLCTLARGERIAMRWKHLSAAAELFSCLCFVRFDREENPAKQSETKLIVAGRHRPKYGF